MNTTQVATRESRRAPGVPRLPPGAFIQPTRNPCGRVTPLLHKDVRMYIICHMANDTTKTFLDAPLAFFLTWTTHGSWLPGDARGWVDHRGIIRAPNERLVRVADSLMREPSVVLATPQRHTVERAIHEHCRFRGWMLHAVSCRTTHVHTVVSAIETTPEVALRCLKAWCSRQLSADAHRPRKWWTKGGSMRRLYDTRGIEALIEYVVECQDRPHH